MDLFGLPAATSLPTDYFITRFSKIDGDDEKGLPHLAAEDHQVKLLQVRVVHFKSLYLKLHLARIALFRFRQTFDFLTDGYVAYPCPFWKGTACWVRTMFASAHQLSLSYRFHAPSGILQRLRRNSLYMGTEMQNPMTP